MADHLRLDKYLWAIRMFKTRSLATQAIDAGKVRMKGELVKPSKAVTVGDKYDIKGEARNWNILVTGLLPNRVSFTDAQKYYDDHTPEDDRKPREAAGSIFNTGKRMSKIGRPTKKQRRELDDFKGE